MKINEIFYSIQGEGTHAGTPAVFVRFAGCNVSCSFCDTDHIPYVEMSEEEIISEVTKYPASLVVVTGGEPSLQLTDSLVDSLHAVGRYIAVETNGTRVLPTDVDWITISPKVQYVGAKGTPILRSANEVKVLFDGVTEVSDYGIDADHYYLQPLDTGDKSQNEVIVAQLVEYIKAHPKWKISLQIHKVLNIR